MGFLSNLFQLNTNLSKLIVGLGGIGTVGGIIYLSNVENPQDYYLLREVSGENGENGEKKSTILDGKKFSEFNKVNHDYRKIINGDTSYNNGNYIIYYGSEACPHCTHFIFGDPHIASGNIWLDRDKMSDGAWMKAYEFASNDEDLKNKNIKFLMFEDVPEIPEDAINDDLWTLPWSKWDTTDLEKGKVQGEYKRHDQSAKDFRKVMDAAVNKFGDKVSGTPTVILYKNGKGAVFNKDTLEGLNDQKQDESLSNELALKRYIKYFYTRIRD